MHLYKRCIFGLAIIAFGTVIISLYSVCGENFCFTGRSYLNAGRSGAVEFRYDELWRKKKTNSGLKNDKKVKEFLKSTEKDIMHMVPPTFLKDLKSPCWYEDSSFRKERHLRCLPYFMLIGQPKSGTSDVFRSIASHPDVVNPSTKEPQYWARHRHCYCCGKRTYWFMCRPSKPWTWSEYLDCFKRTALQISTSMMANSNESRHFITGDGSVSTLWDNRWWWNYPQNINDEEPPPLLNAHYIRHFLPNEKFIIVLRDPVDRLYSEYLYFSSKKVISPEKFHQEVTKMMTSFEDCLGKHDVRYCLYHNSYDEHKNTTVRLFNSIYVVFIRDWFEVFPRDQFFILRLEDYSKRKQETMKEIFEFLGLREAEYNTNSTQANKRGPKSSSVGDMLNITRSLLNDFYKPYTRQLAELLNDNRFLWND